MSYRKSRTLDEWMEVITTSRQSGLSDTEWCRRNDIPTRTFENAVSRLRKHACELPLPLKASPHCSTPLMDRESVPICIPIVGGRSVGKTAFITAFSKEFIDEVAPTKSWDIEFYNDKKEEIYKEIQQDYSLGSTRMTDRPSDINKASSISFSFFVKGKEFSPERLVHVYDIAGEVFTDNNENEIQKQYEYCQGMVLMIDPFAIPSVRHRCEEQLSPEDIAGIGKADINSIVDSFLNKLREVTGLTLWYKPKAVLKTVIILKE